MANQIQATVYQIDGSPLSEPKQISFLTSDILMRPNSISTTPEVLSSITYYPNTSNQLQEQTFYVSENLGDLVTASNTGGTTQLVATVFEINGDPIPGGLYFSFPADAVAISAIIDAEPIQASIQFKNKRYSVSDSLSSLVSAANSGGGGGGGTNPTNNFIPVNQTGVFQDSSIENSIDNFLQTFSNLSTATPEGIYLDFTNQAYYLGDFNVNVTGTYFFVDEPNQKIATKTNNLIKGLDIDFASNIYKFGDLDLTNTFGSNLQINASNNTIATYYQGSVRGLGVDFINEQYQLLDSFTNTGFVLNTNSYSANFLTYVNGRERGLKFSFNANEYIIGDNWQDSVKLFMSYASEEITTYFDGNRKGLSFDFNTSNFYIGDFDNINDGNMLHISGNDNTCIFENLTTGQIFGVDFLNNTLITSANLITTNNGTAVNQNLKINVAGTDYVIQLRLA
jgi:hypothetical protein